MSPYAQELAHARLDALRALIEALNQAETPDEKRRCAVAIFNAPDPCDLDDEIEHDDDDEDTDDEDPDHTPGMSESSSESRGYKISKTLRSTSSAPSAASIPSPTTSSPPPPKPSSDPISRSHRDVIAGIPHTPMMMQAAIFLDDLESRRMTGPPG